MSLGDTAVFSGFIAVLTVLVAAPMGLITMLATPDTPTPTLTVAPATIGAVGVFGAITVVGVLTILGVTAAGGELA